MRTLVGLALIAALASGCAAAEWRQNQCRDGAGRYTCGVVYDLKSALSGKPRCDLFTREGCLER